MTTTLLQQPSYVLHIDIGNKTNHNITQTTLPRPVPDVFYSLLLTSLILCNSFCTNAQYRYLNDRAGINTRFYNRDIVLEKGRTSHYELCRTLSSTRVRASVSTSIVQSFTSSCINMYNIQSKHKTLRSF